MCSLMRCRWERLGAALIFLAESLLFFLVQERWRTAHVIAWIRMFVNLFSVLYSIF